MIKSIGVIVGLALTTSFFAGCGSKSGAEAEEKPTMEESIAVIEKLGGRFSDDGKVLELMSTKVTGAGLAHLKGMTGLRGLDLNNTEITDAGLVHLKGLTGLEVLDLGSTKVTDAGVEKLQAALPECRISH